MPGVFELLKIVCEGINVVFPDAVYPVIALDEGVATQVKLVPATFDCRLTFADVAPLQIVCAIGELITKGSGFIVTIWLSLEPVHPLKDGVTA